ncbi:hypothetical protein A1O7_05841 [Cladophialophora yegresii CBS 114405]|uniref:Uncharacterized protein n=1 Tax=Cladophialophora yegresii CBS 114405 TaxID=1182544 RepID=W9W1N4_9EURO|nr:uncharacterized protein A1O7_05841 [Cladophialophora yegresii CBS 114405]EXJ58416.1 hypothetical protein A1O7_05841 [Cladophialophora yegresii CBS 114405]
MAQSSGNGVTNPQTAVNDQFISKIKASVQFDDSFNTALVSIPTTIAPLAKANMYAALPATASVDMAKVIDRSIFTTQHSLAACLETVVNACVSAFDMAETNFFGISARADDVFSILGDAIFPGLAEMETAPTPKALARLKNAMEDLRTKALVAEADTADVSKSFDHVLAMSMALRQATVDLSSISEDSAKQAQMQAWAASLKVQGQETAVKTASATLEQNKALLDDVRERYKKASDDFPNTMQVMGAAIAMSVTDCLTNVITQVVPMLVMNETVAGQVEGGVQVAEKTGVDITKTVKDFKSSDPNTVPVENPTAPKTVDYAGDAGYLLAPLDKPTITHLQTLATSGADGGINWDEVDTKATTPSSDPSALSYIINQLETASEASSLTDKPPSQKLKDVLHSAIQTAKAIQSAAKDGHSLTSASDKVKAWQQDILNAAQSLASLCTTANSNPGTSGALGATFKAIPSTAANASATTSAAKSLLDGATANLHEQQQALNSALTNYTSASQTLADDQAALGKMKADLVNFKLNAHILNEVVAILTLVNMTLLDFKIEINKLVLHFQSLAKLVAMVVDENMNTFLKDLQTEVQDSEDNIARGGLGGIKVSDLALQIFYTAACTLAAYFDLFGDVTSMYVDTSRKFISDGISGGGLALVSKMGASFPRTPFDPAHPDDTDNLDLDKPADATGADNDPLVQQEIQARLAEIEAWTTATTTGISAVLQTKHATAQEKMTSHLKSLAAEMQRDEQTRKALLGNTDDSKLLEHIKEGQKQGAQAVTDAAKTGLQNTVLLSGVPDVARSEGPIDIGSSRVS